MGIYPKIRISCFESRLKVGICNPSTRELHMFPQIKFKNYPDIFPCIMYFLGYDPIEDQYKVLAIDNLPWRLEYKVVVFLYYGASRKD
ncbi:putative F-box protein [Arabidopsis thaliana]